MRWPKGVAEPPRICHEPAHVIDLLPTFLDAAGADVPEQWNGAATLPIEGRTLLPLLRGGGFDREEPLFFEHRGNCAVRDGQWKLVSQHPGRWELYDMERDRTELHDLAASEPQRVEAMQQRFVQWADRCDVLPWEGGRPVRRPWSS